MLMKMKGKWLKSGAFVLIASLLIMQLLLTMPVNASKEESIYKHSKHVAVVYDDSGSMYSSLSKKPSTKWSHANYMMQAFCSLLNPEDSLYVTYMSNYEEPSGIDYLAGDRDELIDQLKNWQGRVNVTPFEAVEKAAEDLLSIEANNEDEYWLVVLTDGEFTNYEGDLTEDLTSWIDTYAKEGKTLKIVFFGIGTQVPISDISKGLLTYSTDADGIVSTMSEIAHTVSARQQADFEIDKSGNIIATISLPVYELVSFTQGGGALKAAYDENGIKLKIVSSYTITAPESFTLNNGVTTTTDATLSGNISHIESTDGSPLQPGMYTFVYDNPITDNSTNILFYI